MPHKCTKTCPYCGAPTRISRKKTCGARECVSRYKSEHNGFRGKKHTDESRAKMRAKARPTPRHEYPCGCGCGETVVVPEWEIKHNRSGKFYVNADHARASIRGEGHPNWRGGGCRYGAKWTAIAKQARERDKVCRKCGKTTEENGRALEVHHIVPYRVCGTHELPNLITLCTTCHRKELISEQIANPPEYRKECMYCGNDFAPDHASQVMCSQECRHLNRRKNERAYAKTPKEMERRRIQQQLRRDRRKAQRVDAKQHRLPLFDQSQRRG